MSQDDAVPTQIPFYRSVSGKLSLLVLVVILFTTLLLTTIDYGFIRSFIRNEIQLELEIRGEMLRRLVLSYVGQQEQRVDLVLAQSRLHMLLGQFVDGTLPGELFEHDMHPILNDVLDSSADVQRVRLVDVTGTVVASTRVSDIDSSLAQTAAFQAGKVEVYLEFSNLFQEAGTSFLSAPILGESAALLGVLILDIDASTLRNSLDPARSGHVTSRTRLGLRGSGNSVHYFYTTGERSTLPDVGMADDKPMAQALQGNSGFMEDVLDYRGVPVVVVYAPIGYRDWGLVTQVDSDEAFGTLRQTFMTVVIAGIILTAVAAMFAMLGVQVLMRPIHRLAEATRRIAAGDYAVRVLTKSRDEVGELGRAFNRMSREVAGHTAELEATVKSRTSELERSRNHLAAVVHTLENQTDLMERDLRRAEAYQKSLLPKELPELEGFSIAALYSPGRIVGGDLYDVIRLDDVHVAFLIADAAGHGASAAMLSVLFKLRVEGNSGGLELRNPSQLFRRINDALVDDVSAPGVFVTAMVVTLNERTRDIVVCSAGHAPLLVVRRSGETVKILRTGPAMGLEKHATYGERRLTLLQGDSVLLYTDGLFDVGDQKALTINELAFTLRNRAGDSHVLEQLFNRGANGGHLHDRDDATLLLLEVNSDKNWSASFTAVSTLAAEDETGPEQAQVRFAETEDQTVLYLRGRVTWKFGQAFFDAATSILEEDRPLVIEMAECDYLDSAMLGTLFEVVEYGEKNGSSVNLQNVKTVMEQAFDELGLTSVLSHIASTPETTPEFDEAVRLETPLLSHQELRLLKAHEVLAELSSHNRDEFDSVIESLRADLVNSQSA